MTLTLPLPEDLKTQVESALREDVGTGDVTAALVPADQRVRGEVISRENAVLCGSAWVTETFHQLDPTIRIRWLAQDGQAVTPDEVLFQVEGHARPVLAGERTALNFLQLLSGVATATNEYVKAVEGTGCIILDTRKTIPGLRTAQKYAVRCGGAQNHRMGLYDMVLIKENHIAAAGSLEAAIIAARKHPAHVKVEVEVETLQELERALAAKPDVIMIDDFSLDDMRKAVALNRASLGHAKLEASGGVSMKSVREIAETGVDFISIGSLTKHVKALDLSMRLQFNSGPNGL